MIRDEIATMVEAAQGTAAEIERGARSSANEQLESARATAASVIDAIGTIERTLSEVQRAVGREHDALRAKIDGARLRSAPAALENAPRRALSRPADAPTGVQALLGRGGRVSGEPPATGFEPEQAETREAEPEEAETDAADSGSLEPDSETASLEPQEDEEAALDSQGDAPDPGDPLPDAEPDPSPTQEPSDPPAGATAETGDDEAQADEEGEPYGEDPLADEPLPDRSSLEDALDRESRGAGTDSSELELEAQRRVQTSSDVQLAELHTIAESRAGKDGDEEAAYWRALVDATVQEAISRPEFGTRAPDENLGRRAKKKRAASLKPLQKAREDALRANGPQT